MPSEKMPLAAYWRLVRGNANFRRLWIAQIVSELGDWFYALAVYNLLLELTGMATTVGLAVVLQVLPQTFIGPTAGVVNDRMSRKRVMIAADIARFVIVLGMLLVRTKSAIWIVFPLLLLETVMAGFFEPARNAVIPNIASGAEIGIANSLSAVTWSMNLAIGAMLGGIAAYALGRDAVFVINAISFLASAWLIGRMRFEEPHIEGMAPLRVRDLVDVSPIREGLHYVRRDPRLIATVCLKGGIGFMGANNVILPLMGTQLYGPRFENADPSRAAILGMSVLVGARGVGALIGPILSGWIAGDDEARMRKLILLGFFAMSVGYLSIGLAPSLWLIPVWAAVAHCGGSTVWVFSTTLLQKHTDDRFRGRVFAADLGICMVSISIMSYLAGVAIDSGFTAQQAAVGTGFAVMIPGIAWSFAMRLWRRVPVSENSQG